jgi:pimeloyl-ACP methyl ester carboxylesterase
MLPIKRLIRGFYRLLLPTVILLVLTYVGSSIWLVSKSAEPPRNPYLMTPEKYGLLSTRAARITDETWTNTDGTTARGWLLRGAEGKPAVILLHRYGADRSWILNLGVKINEATDLTILMPDLRGHGENPPVKTATLGSAETDDVVASMEFLKGLKSENNNPLVNNTFGLYGIELGALAAIGAAAKEPNVKAMAIDSAPTDSNEMLGLVILKRYPFVSSLTSKIAKGGTYFYFYNGNYSRESMCDVAKKVTNPKVLVIANTETERLRTASTELASCFVNQALVERQLDLMPSGYNIINATNEESGTYDLRVIDFFKNALANTEN